MAYIPNTWQAREGTGLNKYTDTTTGQVLTLQSTPDSLTQEGTPFSADWMNHIENGIVDAGLSGSIQQTLPVAEGMTVQAGDVVDVVDGQVTRTIVQENVLSQLGAHSSNAHPALAMLDSQHVLLAYNSGASPYLNIAVYDLTTKQPSITAQTTISLPADISYLCAVALSSTKVALAWRHDSLNYPQVCAIQINDTTITAGAPFTAAGPIGIVHLHAFSETQFLLVSSSSNVGSTYYIPFTVNDNLSCTQGTYQTVSGGFNPSYLARSENFGEGVAAVVFPTASTPKAAFVQLTGSGSAATVTVSDVTGSYNAQSCAIIKTGDDTFIWGTIYYNSGTSGGRTRWATVTIDGTALNVGTWYDTTTLTCGYQTASYKEGNTIHVYGIQTSGQLAESTVAFDGTIFTAGETTPIDGVTFGGYGDSYSIMNGEEPVFVSGLNSKLQMFRFFDQSTATQALALTSGTAGQNVDIAYDGVFDFDGLEVGQSVYDGNDALIAYCPVTGKVNVIGYWKREGKQYITGTYTGTGQYGTSNPNVILYDSPVSIVYVWASSGDFLIFFYNLLVAAASGGYQQTIKWEENQLSWYSTVNAFNQFNESGKIYNYAILKL